MRTATNLSYNEYQLLQLTLKVDYLSMLVDPPSELISLIETRCWSTRFSYCLAATVPYTAYQYNKRLDCFQDCLDLRRRPWEMCKQHLHRLRRNTERARWERFEPN